MKGHVIVFGGGDTAMDAASSAFRCGASRVTIATRRGVADIRAHEEELSMVQQLGGQFLPYVTPRKVTLHKGRVTGLDMDVHTSNRPSRIHVDCDHIVTAFGSRMSKPMISALGVAVSPRGVIDVNPESMQHRKVDWLFAGGDVVGLGSVVEAVQSGKVAALSIDKFLRSSTSVKSAPMFYTAVDHVDVSVNVGGMKLINPFGLSSAPPTTTSAMIRRAFESGWGYAVTKTITLDKDAITNVSPRIVCGRTHGSAYQPRQSSFLNIELISEKSVTYWAQSIRDLKRRYPQHVLIASIMSSFNEKDWTFISQVMQEAGSDGVELNLSCPHMTGGSEKRMGIHCGQDPGLVKEICGWVRSAVGPTFPVFAKLTPNIADVTVIAQAAKKGGATGVTLINTISGLIGLKGDGTPHPGVGYTVKQTSYGGVSGIATRPVALKMISAIAKSVPGFPMLGVGGIESTETAMELLYAGASALQVCSAVMSDNYTLVTDLVNGLKMSLYMRGKNDKNLYQGWDLQSPPLAEVEGTASPRFGSYELQRQKSRSLTVGKSWSFPAPVTVLSIPRVSDVSGLAVKHMTTQDALTRAEHVVARVVESRCINCGKCYMSCADSGYQAIAFDSKTHIPNVTTDCTGCGLCQGVCPIPGAIEMVPRGSLYVPQRGTELGITDPETWKP